MNISNGTFSSKEPVKGHFVCSSEMAKVKVRSEGRPSCAERWQTRTNVPLTCLYTFFIHVDAPSVKVD